MEKDIFKSLPNYMKGFMGQSTTTQKDINRYTKVLEELKAEILANLDRAPEIIYKRNEQAEINSLRLLMTKGERKNHYSIEVIAVTHIKYALQDSKLFGGAK